MSPFWLAYYLTQRNAGKFVQGIFGGDNRIKAVLQRLDRLTLDESRTTTAETLKVVYGLVKDMSKQAYCTCLSLAIEYPSR